jgi:EAL domain-containing protein (putative c-di-GMP-specific phosphodiesterase class I)
LSGELRGAAGRGELELHYQPVVRVTTGQVVGVEALVRWRHPSRGMLPPNQFIPVAEETGLIAEIDNWTIRHACATAAAWRRSGTTADLQVMVNLSAREVGDGDLAARVRAALDDAGLPPAALAVELTETAVMLDQAGTSRSLAQLAEMGVQIAIDDFGTGYSSLLYLKQFPVDKLKVDRTFVQDLGHDDDDRAIVASLVSLAAAVNAVIVAEGVETHEQLDIVGELGCDLAQGYLWSPAVSGDDIPDLVERLNSRPVFALRLTQPHVPEASPGRPSSAATLLPDGDRNRVAAQILQLHHAGASLQTIAAALNRDGSRTARGTEWRAATVAHVVRALVQPR